MGQIVTASPGEHAAGRRSLDALVLFVLLTLVMSWPLVLRLSNGIISTDVNALNDTYFNIWILGWQSHQLLIDPLHLFQGNIFYPFANTLAFSEIIFPEAILFMPVFLATGNPVLAYNLVLVAVMSLNGLAMYLWAVDCLRPIVAGRRLHAAGLVAGIIFAFCAYKLGELRHLQLLAAQFIPLAMMYLRRGLARPTARNGFLTALFFALNGLSSLYYAVFLALAVLLYTVLDFGLRRYRLTRAHLVYVGTAAVVVAVLTLPLLIPFFQLESQYHFSQGRDPRLFAARPASYLASPRSSWLYGAVSRDWYVASKGQPLFPGVTVVALALVGTVALFMTRREQAPNVRVLRLLLLLFLWLLALGTFVLSFGPYLMAGRDLNPVSLIRLPYYWLSVVLTPLKSLNAPARLDIMVMFALATLAALGAAWLVGRVGRWGTALAVALAGLILLEYVSIPFPFTQVKAGSDISPIYTFLAAQPTGQPVVELPMGQPTFADQDRYVEYTYNSLYHWQPLVNGYSTFIPADYYALVKDVQSFPSTAALARLKNWGAVFIVVHSDKYKQPADLRSQLADLEGLEHVRDFDNLWLYRIK